MDSSGGKMVISDEAFQETVQFAAPESSLILLCQSQRTVSRDCSIVGSAIHARTDAPGVEFLSDLFGYIIP